MIIIHDDIKDICRNKFKFPYPFEKPDIFNKCICCDGRGYQFNKDGLKVTCPACNGTGKKRCLKPKINIFWGERPPYRPPTRCTDLYYRPKTYL